MNKGTPKSPRGIFQKIFRHQNKIDCEKSSATKIKLIVKIRREQRHSKIPQRVFTEKTFINMPCYCPIAEPYERKIHFGCPCGYVYDQPISDDRRLKMIMKLHKKRCSMCNIDIGKADEALKLSRKPFEEKYKKFLSGYK